MDHDSSAKRPRVVIVGGGFAGISVGKKLRSIDMDVTIIDRNNHHLFQPLLYQVATAALSPGDIASPIRAIFSRSNNFEVLMGEVIDVEKDERLVILEDGRNIPFDYLVLAPGSDYSYFGNDQWSDYAPGLKTIANALEIREQILQSLEMAEQAESDDARRKALTYAVIGGGPTGVEMAGAIAEIATRNMMRDYRHINPDDAKIYLIEATDKILIPYDDDLSKNARLTLERMGVDVLLNSPVKDIRENKVYLEDRMIETPNIIWAAGVGASPLVETLDSETDRGGRLKVAPDCSVPDYPNIFVIGDAAYMEDDEGNPLPQLAPVALQMGDYVGDVIRKQQRPALRKPFHYFDKGNMATIGRAKAVAEIGNLKFTGLMAWLLWSVVHIFFLIGFRNRFKVMSEWIWFYISFRRGVRLITRRVKDLRNRRM